MIRDDYLLMHLMTKKEFFFLSEERKQKNYGEKGLCFYAYPANRIYFQIKQIQKTQKNWAETEKPEFSCL